MIELDFSGLASQPGGTLCECQDAAGVDARVGRCDQADADADAPARLADIGLLDAFS